MCMEHFSPPPCSSFLRYYDLARADFLLRFLSTGAVVWCFEENETDLDKEAELWKGF